MATDEAIIARLLAGVPVGPDAVDALAEPAREIARRVAGGNGNGPLVAFDSALADLVPDLAARQKFREDVFCADPYADPNAGNFVTEAAAKVAAQVKTLAQALAPRPRLPGVVQGILQSRSLSIWYGSPGNLKSNLLLDLCFAAATGAGWLPDLPGKGNDAGFAVTQCPALWLDIDNGEDVIAERLAAFARARSALAATPIHWLTFPNPPMLAVKGLPGLTAYALDIRAGVIVIDNLLRIAGVRDENASEIDGAMVNLRKLAEDTGAAVCLIHHKRKDSLGREGDSLRGHSSIEGGIDTAFLIKREDKQNTVAVKCTKARRKPVETFGALWTYTLADDGETLHEARFWRAEVQDPTARAFDDLKARCLQIITDAGDVGTTQSETVKLAMAKTERTVAALSDLVLSTQVTVERGAHGAKVYKLA
jgi:AAA domain